MNKDFISKTRDFWADALKNNQLAYPSEFVVRFLAHCRTNSAYSRKAIDIGFGSGRHLGLLLREGYRTSGLEIIPEAISGAQDLYKDSPLLEDLFLADFRSQPLPAESFDVIICYGSCLMGERDLTLLHRLLRPGGRLLADFRSPFSWFSGLGKEISPDFYLLDDRAREYSGAYYYFPSEHSIRQQIQQAGFVCENFERYDWWKNNMSELHSWWITWLQKLPE